MFPATVPLAVITNLFRLVDSGLQHRGEALFHHDSQVVKLMILIDLEQTQQSPAPREPRPQAPPDGA